MTLSVSGLGSRLRAMILATDRREWSVRELHYGDEADVLDFLERDPLLNVYLISRILEGGLFGPGRMILVRRRNAPVAVASIGSNVVMAVHRASPEERAAAVTQIAQAILAGATSPRAIISEEELVEQLWGQLRTRVDPPTVVRLRQPVYALTGSWDSWPDLTDVRYGELTDLDRLVPACAAMHREEVGIDPLERDAAAYHERVRELVVQRRSFVRNEQGAITFKTELSAVTPQAVQLMGVWTAPSHRRRGLAREGLREICGHFLRQRKGVTLFVNDFNRPAMDLYESLGFRRIGVNRALIW